MSQRLLIREITSIGLVPEGDNPESVVTLYKRHFSTEEREKLAAQGKALKGGGFPITTVATLKDAVQAFGRAANPVAAKAHIIKRARALGRTDVLPSTWGVSKMQVREDIPSLSSQEDSMERPDLAGLSEDDREKVETTFDSFDTLVKSLEAQVAELTPETDPVDDQPDEVKAEFAKRDDKIVELEKRLAAETDVRQTAEWVAKARPLETVVGDADEAGAKLKEIASAVHEKTMEWLEDRLSKVANVIKADTRIFKELGEGDAGDAIDQIEALAKEAQKSNPDLTDAAARQLVRSSNPALKDAERDLARSN